MKNYTILFCLIICQFGFSQITDTGNKVGIGAGIPEAKLHVHEATGLGTNLGNFQILSRISGRAASINTIMENKWLLRDENGSDWYTIRFHNGLSVDLSYLTPGVNSKTWWERDPREGNQFWGNAASTHMALVGGNLGIGTTDTKGFKLGVKGKIAAEEVKVAIYSNWADFVFENDYDLPTLIEVEQHIIEKGHLKDIPSAKEVKENGIFLGEMDSKLLQKIEELTLYAIDQEKRIRALELNNKNLEDENSKLQALFERLEEIEELLNHKNNKS